MHISNGLSKNNTFGNFVDELFNRSISDIVGTDFTHESPAVNIIEDEDTFELQVAAPGMEKKDFKVIVEKDFLTISAEKEQIEQEEQEDHKYYRKEYNYQNFSRRFRLPNTVDKNTLSAHYKQGILKVTIEKTREAKDQGPKRIEIK